MVEKKILNSVRLPTLSKTLYEIIELEKKNPISIYKDLKHIIEKDPLLSAHILKVANSPLYGFSQKVRTIPHAIGLLGVKKIRSIAFAFSIFDFLKKVKYQPEFGKTFNLILKKSLLISALATLLAQRMEHVDSDELYICGLLADIGQMILFLYAPEKYRSLYSSIDRTIIASETKEFDTDHVKLGIEFCDSWDFPDFIRTVISNHFSLGKDDAYSKIAFIANELAEFLLSEKDSDRRLIFKDLENYAKKLLRLSLSEIEETIKGLPKIMETYINDFPEVQDDLNKVIEASSSLILTLMKKEMDMIILAQELSDSQEKLAREKKILSHMLNLSYFFSSLMSPEKIISSLFEYFEKYIEEFKIEFIYKMQDNGNFLFMEGKEQEKGISINIENYESLVKAKLSNETVRVQDDELEKLGKHADDFMLVFPISFHHNLYGFLLLKVPPDSSPNLELEIPYIQILANIIANSFQNYNSFRKLRKETEKKEHVTRELNMFDRQLDNSKKNLLKLQKSEIMGEMMPVIFHKLKNKLTPILGYSQILLGKVKEDEGLTKRVKKIEKNANELTGQLNLLRDYFECDPPAKEHENVNNIISRIRPCFNEIETLQGTKIILDLDYNLPDTMLIPGHIEFLITNIIDNAGQAVKEKEGGIIEIKTHTLPDGFSISVRDNGIGMNSEILPNIWTPFYSKFDKTGLGLSVCEKILSLHDMTHTVESEEGSFTEITLTFKNEEPEEADVCAGATGEEAAEEEVRGKVLIVDDEAYLVDLMKEILLNEGNFEITATTDGREALKMPNTDFDLIISDIRMPEISGIEIYNYFKGKNMQTKVMMVTADPFSEDVANFLKKNDIDYLRKPFELMEFKKRALAKLAGTK
ncbi:MAG: HDOD domain-containing protein [bacterium]|nr:HDOD domain-containing protein [bacterium]